LPVVGDDGKATFPVAVDQLPSTTRLLTANVTVRMRESGGRAVEKALTLGIKPESDLIGIKPEFSGGEVPQACCGGIKNIVATASSTTDRRAACTCLKNVARGVGAGPYLSRAAGLPGRCGVQLPYKISPNVNCDSYVTHQNPNWICTRSVHISFRHIYVFNVAVLCRI
jgi:hypothetical protein